MIRLALEDRVEDVAGLGEIPLGQIEAAQRHGQAGVQWTARQGALEVRDGVVERRLGGARGRSRFDAALELGGDDGAEHPVRLGVLGIDRQRLTGGARRVLGAVGARVEGGDLGGDGGALRVGHGGQPVRLERLRNLAEGFEVPAADELEVGCGRRGLRGRGLRSGGLRRAERGHQGRQEHRATGHEIELFHAAGVLTRAGAAARRHSAMKILLVRLRLIGDVVFTTPAVAAIRGAFPDAADHLPRRARGRTGGAGTTRASRRASSSRRAAGARIAADLALARGCGGGRFDLVDRLPRRAARVVSDVGDRRADAGSATRSGPGVDVHASACRGRAAPPPAPLGREPMGSAAPSRPIVAARTGSRPASKCRWMNSRGRGAVADRLAATGVDRDARSIVIHVSAGNPFRRWPSEPFRRAGRGHARREDPARRSSSRQGHPSAKPPSAIIAAARTRLPAPAAARSSACGEFSLVGTAGAGRARGAATSAATAGRCTSRRRRAVPIVALYGPTLPERSAPWRQPRRRRCGGRRACRAGRAISGAACPATSGA